MFTGIVQGVAELVAIEESASFRTHVIRMPSREWGEGLALGASVAHNGCCLTVTRVEGDLVSFDLMQETLRLTNLGLLQVGDKVNVERAARFGDEIGGHAMSGHIIGMAEGHLGDRYPQQPSGVVSPCSRADEICADQGVHRHRWHQPDHR